GDHHTFPHARRLHELRHREVWIALGIDRVALAPVSVVAGVLDAAYPDQPLRIPRRVIQQLPHLLGWGGAAGSVCERRHGSSSRAVGPGACGKRNAVTATRIGFDGTPGLTHPPSRVCTGWRARRLARCERSPPSMFGPLVAITAVALVSQGAWELFARHHSIGAVLMAV